MKTCWQILEITPTKDKAIIRKAYSEKVKQYHPEDDPQMYQSIRVAYEEAIHFAAQKSRMNANGHEKLVDKRVQNGNRFVAQDLLIQEEPLCSATKHDDTESNDTMLQASFEKIAEEEKQFIKAWITLYEAQADIPQWQLLFQQYSSYPSVLSDAASALYTYHTKHCIMTPSIAVFLRIHLVSCILHTDASPALIALDQMLKDVTAKEADRFEGQAVLEPWIQDMYNVAVYDWAKLEYSKMRDDEEQWKNLFQTLCLRLVKTDALFHQALCQQIDTPRKHTDAVQKRIASELSLSEASAICQYLCGETLHAYDYEAMLSEQTSRIEDVLAQWESLDASAKRKQVREWNRLLQSEAFLKVRRDPEFLTQLANRLENKKPYKPKITRSMREALQITALPNDAVTQKLQAELTLPMKQKTSKGQYVLLMLVLSVVFVTMNLLYYSTDDDTKDKKLNDDAISQNQQKQLDKMNRQINQGKIRVIEKDGKKYLMNADEVLMEVEDARDSSGNLRAVKVNGGWHFYDIEAQALIEDTYEDIFCIDDVLHMTTYFAVKQKGVYGVLDGNRAEFLPFKYQKQDLEGKEIFGRALIDEDEKDTANENAS